MFFFCPRVEHEPMSNRLMYLQRSELTSETASLTGGFQTIFKPYWRFSSKSWTANCLRWSGQEFGLKDLQDPIQSYDQQKESQRNSPRWA